MASVQETQTRSRTGQRTRPVTAPDTVMIKQGRYCNADLFFYRDARGRLYTLKTFRSKHVLVRNTIGRFMIRREARALTALQHLPGIPSGVRQTGPFSFVMQAIAGKTLAAPDRPRLPPAFFLELEHRIKAMHRAGYVHLDLRNLGNIICGDDGLPYLIDFQSCMRVAALPRFLHRQCRNTDLSGVCKAWRRKGAEPLDRKHAEFMERFAKSRRLWIFQGYFLSKAMKRIRRLVRRRPGKPR